MKYLCGEGRQRFLLEQQEGVVTGVHQGEIYNGNLTGKVHAQQVKFSQRDAGWEATRLNTRSRLVDGKFDERDGGSGRIWPRPVVGHPGDVVNSWLQAQRAGSFFLSALCS